jgi:hypothetical protein
MAKTRLQRRQTLWRSGRSTTSTRRHASTGHGAKTVAQEGRLARSGEASRRSPRAWSFYLQALISTRRKPVSLPAAIRDFEGGARRLLLPEHSSDHEGRRAPARRFADRCLRHSMREGAPTNVQIYAVSGERSQMEPFDDEVHRSSSLDRDLIRYQLVDVAGSWIGHAHSVYRRVGGPLPEANGRLCEWTGGRGKMLTMR